MKGCSKEDGYVAKNRRKTSTLRNSYPAGTPEVMHTLVYEHFGT